MKASVRKIPAGVQAYHWLESGEEITATGRTPAIARKNLARELERHKNPRKEQTMDSYYKAQAERTDEAERGLIPAIRRATTSHEDRQQDIESVTQGRTIWNSDGSDGPCLICAPSHADIQRMAGFPVDDEDRALAVEDAQIAEQAEKWGAEAEPYTQEEIETRRRAAGDE